MNELLSLPVRPDISLIGILGYALFAFAFTLLFTPPFVSFLLKNKVGKQLRVETVDGRDASIFRMLHKSKHGTPTMGGVLIWTSIVLTVLISRLLSFFGTVDHSLLQRGQVYLPLFTLVMFGILGGVDDYLNVKGVGTKRGMNAIPKLVSLIIIALLGGLWFYYRLGYDSIHLPYIGNFQLGFWYVPVFVFIVAATSNAVNVTDGLDGLAAGLLAIAFAAFGILAYSEGLAVLAGFCAVCVGAIAAFLWHNVPPALFFMGDTGSLALGGTLAVMAMMIDQALVLPLVGFIFVIEMLSVLIQLTSKKLRGGKKVFLAAPIHHHFEALQWGESKVTMRFWIIGIFMAFLGLVVGLAG
jgi:phospho-N-acetylmuramoyl-pentapeptide-transferase